MTLPNAAKKTEKYRLDRGTGKLGSVTAMATARQAETEGALKGHAVALVVFGESVERMQGYAVANIVKTAGARKTAISVPIACARYWRRCGVPRRKPTRKSPVRSMEGRSLSGGWAF